MSTTSTIKVEAFRLTRPVAPSAVAAGLHVPAVFFGVCTKCKSRVRVQATVAGNWPGKKTWLDVAGVRREVKHYGTFAGTISAKCCGENVPCFPITATIAENHECGAGCRRAKGCSCDCSCGGEFHGVDA